MTEYYTSTSLLHRFWCNRNPGVLSSSPAFISIVQHIIRLHGTDDKFNALTLGGCKPKALKMWLDKMRLVTGLM